MKLSKSSLLFKWAYLFDGTKPEQTTLCDIFWRTVLGTPLACISTGSLILGLAFLLFWVLPKFLWAHKVDAAFGLGLILVFAIMVWLEDRGNAIGDRLSRTIIIEGFRAVKKRYCPIVTITK